MQKMGKCDMDMEGYKEKKRNKKKAPKMKRGKGKR